MAEMAVVQRIDSESFALVAHQTKRFHVRVIDTHVDERDNLIGHFDRSRAIQRPHCCQLKGLRIIVDLANPTTNFYRLPSNRLILALNLEPVSARAPHNRVLFSESHETDEKVTLDANPLWL